MGPALAKGVAATHERQPSGSWFFPFFLQLIGEQMWWQSVSLITGEGKQLGHSEATRESWSPTLGIPCRFRLVEAPVLSVSVSTGSPLSQ